MTQKIITIGAGGLLNEVTDAYQGTVTQVAALTLGTTGTDLSSTVATGTSTPVITLQVPTASASNRGALSATDWTTFSGMVPKSGGTMTGLLQINKSVTFPTLGTASGAFCIAGDAGVHGLYSAADAGTGKVWMQNMRNDGAVAYDIALQPVGGKVSIGNTSASYALDVTGAGRFTVAIINTPVAFASLPAGVTGMRAFVNNNSAAPAFLSAANGSGSTTVPVFHNGTSWLVG